MADSGNRLESNIVLKTTVPKPTGSGFKVTLSELDKIEKKLIDITSKTYTIKIKIDDRQARRLGISVGSPGGGGSLGGGITGTIGGRGTGLTGRSRTQRYSKEGELLGVTDKEIKEAVRGMEQFKNEVQETDGILRKSSASVTDLLEKERLRVDRLRASRQAASKVAREESQAMRVARQSGEQKVRANLFSGNQEFAGVTGTERFAIRQQERALNQQREEDRTQEEKRRALAIKDAERQQREAQKRAADRARQRTRDAFMQQKVDAQQAAGHVASEERFRSGRAVRSRLSALQDQGYKVTGEGQQFNRTKGVFEDTIKLQKVSGNALQGYTVQQVNASIAGRRLNETTLTGAAAWRAVGDSITNAAAKVSVWLAATSLVFATIRGFQALANEIVKLSEGTILLARVGRNLGNTFEERVQAAERLTQSFLELTSAIGGNASEAQKAAAVFTRSGYNEVETMQAVKASLLAAKIAELDVVEAANLLSSATLQFGLQAGDLLPTLDLLNTYSNNYRVTTDDLLQSISRTGSVIAEQAGRISELGAITAITAQVTSRSGSEIGNAIKTISSNLDTLDVRQKVMKQLGVNLDDLAGSSKSYSEVLVDLELASKRLTDAERNQLTIDIAGKRQRNILLAQMKHSLDIVNAEIKTLFEDAGVEHGGGALSEFSDKTKSLMSALERLQASALQAGVGLSAPFQEVAKGAANATNALLYLLNTFNGAPAKLVGLVAMIGGVALGLRYLNNEYGISITSIGRYITQTQQAYTATMAQSGSLAAWNASMRKSTSELAAMNLANLQFLGIAALVVVSLNLASQMVNEYAESLAKAKAAHMAEADASDAGAQQARRKATAYGLAKKQVIQLILEMERLQKLEVSSGKKNPEIDRLAHAARQAAANVGVELEGGRIPNANKAEQKLLQLQQEQQLKEAKDLENQQQSLKKTTEVRERKQKELQQLRLGYQVLRERKPISQQTSEEYAAAERAGSHYLDEAGLTGHFARAATGGVKVAQEKQLYKVVEELAGLEKELADQSEREEKIQERILELRKAGVLTVDQLRRKAELSVQLQQSVTQERKFQEHRPFVEAARENLGQGESIRHLQDDYNTSLKVTQDRFNKLNELTDDLKTNIKEIPEASKAFEDSSARTLELKKKLDALQSKQIQGEVGTRLSQAGSLRVQALLIASRHARSEARASGFTDPLAESNVTRGALFQNIRENVGRRNAFAAFSQTATNPDSREAAKNSAVAANKQILEDTLRLRDLEIQHGITLLDVEQKIAAARKQSADEAARALGTLSDEDKLRVVAQAQYFAKNPDKKISLGQQFLMSGQDVGLGQRFLGGHYEDNLRGDDAFSRMAMRAGLGDTPDLMRAHKEAVDARGGLTDQQILQKFQGRANAVGQFGNQVGENAAANVGIPGIAPGGGNFDLRGNLQPKVDLNVNAQQLDFAPLMHAFEHAFIVVMDGKIVEMTKAVEEVLSMRERIDKKIKIGAGAP